jgi:hypothetical protein
MVDGNVLHVRLAEGELTMLRDPEHKGPKPGPKNRFLILYPSEDRTLLGTTTLDRSLTARRLPAPREHACAAKAEPSDLLFIDENGGPLDLDHMADRVRSWIKEAKPTRADLTSTGSLKGAFGTHCSGAASSRAPSHSQRTRIGCGSGRGTRATSCSATGRRPSHSPNLSSGTYPPGHCLLESLRWPSDGPDGPANGRGGRIRTGDP